MSWPVGAGQMLRSTHRQNLKAQFLCQQDHARQCIQPISHNHRNHARLHYQMRTDGYPWRP